MSEWTDEQLREWIDDEYLRSDEPVGQMLDVADIRRMATELLTLRARVSELALFRDRDIKTVKAHWEENNRLRARMAQLETTLRHSTNWMVLHRRREEEYEAKTGGEGFNSPSLNQQIEENRELLAQPAESGAKEVKR